MLEAGEKEKALTLFVEATKADPTSEEERELYAAENRGILVPVRVYGQRSQGGKDCMELSIGVSKLDGEFRE